MIHGRVLGGGVKKMQIDQNPTVNSTIYFSKQCFVLIAL